MPESLHALFRGTAWPRETERLAGEQLLASLAGRLTAHGWVCGALEAWRDSGWQLACQRQSRAIDLVLAATEYDESGWVLQLAPKRSPGFFAKLLTKSDATVPGTQTDILDVAEGIATFLREAGAYQRWTWDDIPSDHDAPTPGKHLSQP